MSESRRPSDHASYFSESIAVSPWKQQQQWFLSVSLQSNTTFTTSTSTTARTTPAPSTRETIKNLLQEHGLSRLSVQWASSSSTTYPSSSSSSSLASSQRQGPSGVSVTAEFVFERGNEQNEIKEEKEQHSYDSYYSLLLPRFESILRVLVGERILVAPSSLSSTSRLNRRHVLLRRPRHPNPYHSKHTVEVSLALPLEGAPASSEGVLAFLNTQHSMTITFPSTTECLSLPFSTGEMATDLSHILMGDYNENNSGDTTRMRISNHRRSLWMDMYSTCNSYEHHECQVTILQGVHYTTSIPTSASSNDATTTARKELMIPLSTVLPPGILSKASACSSRSKTDETSSLLELRWKGGGSNNATLWNHTAPFELVSEDDHQMRNGGQVLRYSLSDSTHNLEQARIMVDDDPTTETQYDPAFWRLDRTIQRPKYGIANEGVLLTRIENMNDDDDECPTTRVHVIEIIPNYIRPDWSSLAIFMKTEDGVLSLTRKNEHHHYHQLHMEMDGTIRIEWTVTLPPQTSAYSSLKYDPAFLPFQRFPGDPNRGMELPPTRAYFSALCSEGEQEEITLYSDPLLLLPPVPDMSMPFNVISLTCTLYAFIIGSLVNLLVRKSSERLKYKLNPELKPKSKLAELKERIRNKFVQKTDEENDQKQAVSSKSPSETETSEKPKFE